MTVGTLLRFTNSQSKGRAVVGEVTEDFATGIEWVAHRPGDTPISFDKHLYVAEPHATFATTLNQLERQAVDTEIATEDVVGWVRSVDRQK